ncbi:hypothetical protein [Streptomyces sp. NPDC008121]|uniref:hypothetical protein n=1 Tax=Streptomyces sp. NPDC008121 TaxID=3364809 RepID=UPI0036E5B6EA
MDGKTVRSSRALQKPAVALLASRDHTGTVLAQRQPAGTSNEIPAFALLEPPASTG